MDVNPTVASPSSGSKRKRLSNDEAELDPYEFIREGQRQAPDSNAHTPKRGPSQHYQSDAEASEDTGTVRRRGLRRKKKANNLSLLNIRHAAEMQSGHAPRESRFLEGSLTDKPSSKPPDVFTQMVRTDSGNLKQVDDLMDGYHDGHVTPRDSMNSEFNHEAKLTFHQRPQSTEQPPKKDEGSGFFRFGRSLASNFHPISLWNKLWNESKEELTRQNMEEAARKARLKAEAEAKYAQMKHAGQLRIFPNTTQHSHSQPRVVDENLDPHDSGIVVERSSWDDVIHRSQVPPPPPPKDTTSMYYSGSEHHDSEIQSSKGIKSRLHFRRPSLMNLKKDLKRAKSEYNLPSPMDHESSSSMSPLKTDLDIPTVKKSASKFDIRRQYRLSKRVSDLETKLQQARQELNDALVDASPMPKLGDRYERFTTSSNISRPKFVPGKLPTLPSERILLAEQIPSGTEGEDAVGSDDGGDTIKPTQPRAYPARASSLFSFNSNPDVDVRQDVQPVVPEQTQKNNLSTMEMDIQSDQNDLANKQAATSGTTRRRGSDQKGSKPKKRKTAKGGSDGLFRPGKDNDSASDEEAVETPRKRRKPSSKAGKTETTPVKSSPATRRGKKSPHTKKTSSSPADAAKISTPTQIQPLNQLNSGSLDLTAPSSGRPSLDSQGQPLEPLYEEDEETSTIPIKYDPTESIMLTPARYVPPPSPSKKAASPKKSNKDETSNVETAIMTRAAMAAQAHPGRRHRSFSPTEENNESAKDDDAIRLVPGLGNVPVLPGPRQTRNQTGTSGDLERKRKRQGGVNLGEKFEWPDDVF